MIKVGLLDCDVLTYRAGFAADSQAKKEYGEDKYMEEDFLPWALNNTKTVIEATAETLGVNLRNCRYFLTGKGNFRDEIATIKPYKGNRDKTHKPKYYQEIRDYLLNNYNAEMCEGYEADDAMAMAQWGCPDRSTCIVSIDKDLDMIPGWHYNWMKSKLYDVSLKNANYHFYWQMLVGDTTDNIPGVFGIGAKTADKMLNREDSEENWKEIVKREYHKMYGNDKYEEALREVAGLLWMWRKPNDEPPVF